MNLDNFNLDEILNYSFSIESLLGLLDNWMGITVACLVVYFLGFLTLGKFVARHLARKAQLKNKADYPNTYRTESDGLYKSDRDALIIMAVGYPIVILGWLILRIGNGVIDGIIKLTSGYVRGCIPKKPE